MAYHRHMQFHHQWIALLEERLGHVGRLITTVLLLLTAFAAIAGSTAIVVFAVGYLLHTLAVPFLGLMGWDSWNDHTREILNAMVVLVGIYFGMYMVNGIFDRRLDRKNAEYLEKLVSAIRVASPHDLQPIESLLDEYKSKRASRRFRLWPSRKQT